METFFFGLDLRVRMKASRLGSAYYEKDNTLLRKKHKWQRELGVIEKNSIIHIFFQVWELLRQFPVRSIFCARTNQIWLEVVYKRVYKEELHTIILRFQPVGSRIHLIESQYHIIFEKGEELISVCWNLRLVTKNWEKYVKVTSWVSLVDEGSERKQRCLWVK